MTLQSPQQIITLLEQNELFQKWFFQHPQAYLSHLFLPINEQIAPLSDWELGYFDPTSQKITVFVPLENNDFEIKPADDVFKQETSTVETLAINTFNLTLDVLFPLIAEKLKTYFPKEQIGNGFLIIQTLNNITLYNVTFITRSIQFINLKINAQTGVLESHQTIELLDKKQPSAN